METNKETYGIPNVYAKDLEKLAKKVQSVTENENAEISFEFVIASLFPTCWTNIQNALINQYTLGYIAGVKESSSNATEDDAECFCD